MRHLRFLVSSERRRIAPLIDVCLFHPRAYRCLCQVETLRHLADRFAPTQLDDIGFEFTRELAPRSALFFLLGHGSLLAHCCAFWGVRETGGGSTAGGARQGP